MAPRGPEGDRPRYVLFLDESGDHTINYANLPAPDPPDIFLLSGCLFGAEGYRQLRSAMDDLKWRYFRRTDVWLVSRRIRKQEGQFTFLTDRALREEFLNDISSLIRGSRFRAFAAGIDKFRHWLCYRENARSPYHLSLAFIMERVIMCSPDHDVPVRVVAESRTPQLDADLRAEYNRLLREGTPPYFAAERFRNCFLPELVFRRKQQNDPGLQIADLVAYPLSQRLRFPESRSPAFEVVWEKLYASRQRVWGYGLKVFPAASPADFGL